MAGGASRTSGALLIWGFENILVEFQKFFLFWVNMIILEAWEAKLAIASSVSLYHHGQEVYCDATKVETKLEILQGLYCVDLTINGKPDICVSAQTN